MGIFQFKDTDSFSRNVFTSRKCHYVGPKVIIDMEMVSDIRDREESLKLVTNMNIIIHNYYE